MNSANNIKISVIIPIYNTAPYLRRCLDSVCAQTLHEIEIICVNDASTDDSLDILKEYTVKDARIQLFENENNIGEASSRNRALAHGRGDYVGFVDSDDAIELDFFEKLYNAACKSHADIAKGETRKIEINGRQTLSKSYKTIKSIGKIAFNNSFWSAIYKRSLIQENTIIFPDGITNGADLVFLTKVVLKTNTICCVDGAYYIYFHRNDSMDSLILSKKQVASVLNVKLIIANIINTTLGINITSREYDFLFYAMLLSILDIANRNKSKFCKYSCAETMILLYNQCKRQQALDAKLSEALLSIYDILRTGNIDDLEALLTLPKAQLIAYNLRKKICNGTNI